MSKLSENLTASEGPDSFRQAREYSPEQRKVLLKIAHEVIAAKLVGKPLPSRLSLAPLSSSLWAPLEQPRGVFTTLYLRGELRGCVGYVAPIRPLFQAVAYTACAAAF